MALNQGKSSRCEDGWRIFRIFRVFGGTFTAPTGGTVGVSRCHALKLYMRYDKKIKSTKNPKTFIFSTKNIFRKILKNRTFQKVTFFEKVDFFEKSKKWVFFLENVDFFENVEFFNKNRKSDFLKFSIFQNLSKNIFHRKK